MKHSSLVSVLSFAVLSAAFSISSATPVDADVRGCMQDVGTLVKRGMVDATRAQLEAATTICKRTGGDFSQALRVFEPSSQPAKPKIVEFRVSPARVRPGQFVSFFWRVSDATHVTLSDKFGIVEESDELRATGTSSIALKETTTFRLVAENRRGQKQARSFTVHVVNPSRPTNPPRPRRSDGCENLPAHQQAKCGG